MAGWSDMGGGTRTATVALGVAGVALLGYALWPRSAPGPDPLAVVAPVADGAVAPDAAPEAVPGVEVAPAPALPEAVPAVATVASLAPAFDNWRVDADGSSVVAGRAPAGALVTVLVDGVPVAEARTTARGEFVALFTLPANPNPSLMTLSVVLADGSTLASLQTVALGAVSGAVAVALAEPVGDATLETPADPPADPLVGQPSDKPIAAPPVAVLVTDEGVRVLQLAPPEDGASVPVNLDAIAYTISGDVQLSGVGQVGQFVRLYLDEAHVVTVPVGSAGQWSVTLGDTPAGLYTLRIDQVDATGTVTARFETPFNRETREALAALVPAPAQSAQQPPDQTPEQNLAQTRDPSPPTATVESQPDGDAVQQGSPKPDTTQPDAALSDATLSDTSQPDTRLADTGLADSTATVAKPTETLAPEGVSPPGAVPMNTAESVAVLVPETGTATDMLVADDSAAAPMTPTDAPTDQNPPPVVGSVNAPAAPDATLPPARASALTEPAAEGAAPLAQPSVSITVQPGYTLWGIARQQLGEGVLYVQVFEANKDRIRNPDLIYPGQIFVLPTR